MSPTMVHHDDDRGLVFQWHGGAVIAVYTAGGYAERDLPFDTIDVWDVQENAPALACTLGALRAEAACYTVPAGYRSTEPPVEPNRFERQVWAA